MPNENGFYTTPVDRPLQQIPNAPTLQQIKDQRAALEQFKIDRELAKSVVNDPSTPPKLKAKLVQKFFPSNEIKSETVRPGDGYNKQVASNLFESFTKGTDPFEYAKLAGMNEDLADNMSLATIPFSLGSLKGLTKLRGKFDDISDIAVDIDKYAMKMDDVHPRWKSKIQYDNSPLNIGDPERRDALKQFMYEGDKRPVLVNERGIPVPFYHGTGDPNVTEFAKDHVNKSDLGWLGKADVYGTLGSKRTPIEYQQDHSKRINKLQGGDGQGKLMTMYSNVENPLIVDDDFKHHVSALIMPFDMINNRLSALGKRKLTPQQIMEQPQLVAREGFDVENLQERWKLYEKLNADLDERGYDAVMLMQGNSLEPEWEIAIRNSLGKVKEQSSSGFDPKVKNVYKALPFALGGLGAASQMGDEK